MSATGPGPSAIAADAKGVCSHTAGPWIFYADTPSIDRDWHIVTTGNRLRVVANVHIEPGNGTDLANARLIAAAPELLAVAVMCAELAERHGEQGPLVQAARAAIAKATGSET